MARQVRIGIQIQPEHVSYQQIQDALGRVEAAGADIVFNWDHFFPLHGDRCGANFECWTMLGAWAATTQHIEIGALVTCNSYRNPDLLADMARTVDHISNGRLILGLGAGWYEPDYQEYGYEFGTVGSRLADLEAALPRISRRLGLLNPPPTRHIPLLIGGDGERKTLRYAARHADIWNGFGDLPVFSHKSAVLDDWCRVEGRDPANIERSTVVAGDPWQIGPPLLAAGCTLFVLSLSAPKYDITELQHWISWRDEVRRAAL